MLAILPLVRVLSSAASFALALLCTFGCAADGLSSEEPDGPQFSAALDLETAVGRVEEHAEWIRELRVEVELARDIDLDLGGATLRIPASGVAVVFHKGRSGGRSSTTPIELVFDHRNTNHQATLSYGWLFREGISSVAWNCAENRVNIRQPRLPWGRIRVVDLEAVCNEHFRDQFPDSLRACGRGGTSSSVATASTGRWIQQLSSSVRSITLRMQAGREGCTDPDFRRIAGAHADDYECWRESFGDMIVDYHAVVPRASANGLELMLRLDGSPGRFRLARARLEAHPDASLTIRGRGDTHGGMRLGSVELIRPASGTRPEVQVNWSLADLAGDEHGERQQTRFELWRDGTIQLTESGFSVIGRELGNESIRAALALLVGYLSSAGPMLEGQTLSEVIGLSASDECSSLRACLDGGGGAECWERCGDPRAPVCDAVLGCLGGGGGASCFRRDCGVAPRTLSQTQLACLAAGGSIPCFSR